VDCDSLLDVTVLVVVVVVAGVVDVASAVFGMDSIVDEGVRKMGLLRLWRAKEGVR
jgi:hypothetical protein